MALSRCGSCRKHFDYEVTQVCPFCGGLNSRVSTRSLTRGAALAALLTACGGPGEPDTTPEPVNIAEPEEVAPETGSGQSQSGPSEPEEPVDPESTEPAEDGEPVNMPLYGAAPEQDIVRPAYGIAPPQDLPVAPPQEEMEKIQEE